MHYSEEILIETYCLGCMYALGKRRKCKSTLKPEAFKRYRLNAFRQCVRIIHSEKETNLYKRMISLFVLLFFIIEHYNVVHWTENGDILWEDPSMLAHFPQLIFHPAVIITNMLLNPLWTEAQEDWSIRLVERTTKAERKIPFVSKARH